MRCKCGWNGTPLAMNNACLNCPRCLSPLVSLLDPNWMSPYRVPDTVETTKAAGVKPNPFYPRER